MTTDTGSRTSTDQQPRTTQPRPKSLGHDLPQVQRRYGQWAGAVLFVVMAVLLAGWFWQERDDRVAVLAVTGSVAAGEEITADDLQVIEVSGVNGAIRRADTASVVGSTAAVGLVDGQVLTHALITRDPVPGAGERVVGLQLDPTRAPARLLPGDVVIVVAVPPAGDPSTPSELDSPDVLANRATVASAELIEGAGTRLTLLVPNAVGERVTAYIAAGRVALLEAPIGGDD